MSDPRAVCPAILRVSVCEARALCPARHPRDLSGFPGHASRRADSLSLPRSQGMPSASACRRRDGPDQQLRAGPATLGRYYHISLARYLIVYCYQLHLSADYDVYRVYEIDEVDVTVYDVD